MSNYSQQSKVLLVTAINEEKGTFISPNDVYFIGPTPSTKPGYDTTVTMVALESSPYRDSKVIDYNKVELAGIFNVPLVFTARGNVTTTSDLIKQLNAEYALQLDDTDIIVEPVTPKLLSSTVASFVLKAAPDALIIKGEMIVYFSDTNSIRKWSRNASTEFTTDGKTIDVSGANRRVNGKVVLGDRTSFKAEQDTLALALGSDGKYKEVSSYPTNDPVKLRYKDAQLLEIVGASDETSYDRDGKLLRVTPHLPPIFEALSNVPEVVASFTDTEVDFNPSYLLNVHKSRSGVVYYVDSVSGNDLTGNGTEQAPFKSMNSAITKSPLARTIIIKEGSEFFAGEGLSIPIVDRSLDLISSGDTKVTFSGALRNGTWTKQPDHDNTYYATTNVDVSGVVDYAGAGASGNPSKLVKVSSLSEMKATPATWYFDNGRIYVHTANNRKPDTDIKTVSNLPILSVMGNSQVYLEGITVTDSIFGVVVEATATDKRPSFYAVKCIFKNSLGNGFSNYGAISLMEECKIASSSGNGSFFGMDRQSPGLGIKAKFGEYLCNYDWNGTTDPFAGASSTATAGTVGIRCKTVITNSFGRPIFDYGTNTATANYMLKLSAGSITDVQNGALITCGHPDTTNFGRSMILVFSSALTPRDGVFAMSTLGNGNLYLYDTPVGKMGQYGLADPYKFIYTSKQRKAQ